MCSLDRGHIIVQLGREGVPVGVVLSIGATGVAAENESAGDHALRNPGWCIAAVEERRAGVAQREETVADLRVADAVDRQTKRLDRVSANQVGIA